MKRYLVNEPRIATEYPEGNQMTTFPGSRGGNNNVISADGMYFGTYGGQFTNISALHPVYGTGFMGAHPSTAVNTSGYVANKSVLPLENQGHVMSGIDPTYLGAYPNNNVATFMTNETPNESNTGKQYQLQSNNTFTEINQLLGLNNKVENKKTINEIQPKATFNSTAVSQEVRKPTSTSLTESSELQNATRTRFDILKELHKNGPRVFTGSVENVLKWHKQLQDIGVMVLYETVAKCVNVRPGESCAKILVVRDDNGPAMQVVYYEIDFMLPELKIPCMVRIIGRMLPGTSRLQAFHVRVATGDDVATMPRHAAVAAHHVAKLCKDYGKKSSGKS